MKATGLIVEYNPFHNGHMYHIEESKKATDADCIIAVMSGSFLQRGEPAIIDKYHRTKAAIKSGIDIVLELPYVYAVQNSDIFAHGAVHILNEIGVSSICFGSESGNISPFLSSYETFKNNENIYNLALKQVLADGKSFPEASRAAYEQINLTTKEIDLAKPNNILGFSYVRAILDNELPIDPITIKRTKNNYHDESITSNIASATSIRKLLIEHNELSATVKQTIPKETVIQLQSYNRMASFWHTWELYFPILHYRAMTMPLEELGMIHGIDEGLEHRIKRTAKQATSFQQWVTLIKTKRYTWTRIQRLFVHLLTNTKKSEITSIIDQPSVPYVRVLGLTNTGKNYLNMKKKKMEVPIFSNIKRDAPLMLRIEERASNAYYSILPPEARIQAIKQEYKGPIIH
ncbi:nucleotidyltransferase [Oceanobacillus sp. 143]|uniref:tRNA(Met) cytidine acetate ligase n=1 Tax=Oceanobacillus zhaokaii TaxID=2052660 RepID=A0A345PG53_9BACI|nr:nucleotidyltransferase [Oceanobacillus zhaokaii]AXI08983.1 nucleotidyltransferase [Oceanobacillus zhaokaii]QGS68601.1 nucleotidyltransferase [Oceanobacillus sp. 143]